MSTDNQKTFFSTKTYGNERGLSACFRQWRATHSHCSKLHGYAIGVKFKFATQTLDARNWVVDFGGLSDVKQFLEDTFDHKTLVALDDPDKEHFDALAKAGVIDLVYVPAVGCEQFANLVFDWTTNWLNKVEPTGRVKLVSVEVFEHGSNSAGVER